MIKKEYNGYTNYETWLTALWIDNDPGLMDTALEMATAMRSEYTLSNDLKDWISEMSPAPEFGLFADFVNASLSEVNWYELAEGYIEQVREDEAE
jgi:hypothetical protein